VKNACDKYEAAGEVRPLRADLQRDGCAVAHSNQVCRPVNNGFEESFERERLHAVAVAGRPQALSWTRQGCRPVILYTIVVDTAVPAVRNTCRRLPQSKSLTVTGSC
jgi:hypothetical protein